MHFYLVDYVLWFSAPLMQLGVLIAMWKRRLHHDYPFFFTYSLLAVLNAPLLFALKNTWRLYFYAYWGSSALMILVSFAVLLEIFKEAFRPYEALRDLSVILFRWSALVLLLVSGMWAITSPSTMKNGTVIGTIFLAERSVRMMQCGIVFFLLLFSEYLGISRRHVVFGVALGFGVVAASDMLVVTALTHPRTLSHSMMRWLNSGAYDLAALIWLAYTALPAPVRAPAAVPVRPEDWNLALEDARVPGNGESLLDTMDRTVERLLYGKEELKASQ